MLVLLLIAISLQVDLDGDYSLNHNHIGIEWAKGECGGETLCPMFRFELYENDEKTGRYIDMAWNLVAEVNSDGEVQEVTITVPKDAIDTDIPPVPYAQDVTRALQQLPPDFSATSESVGDDGELVTMSATLGFVQDQINTVCGSFPANCNDVVSALVTDSLGSEVWKTTKLKAMHYFAKGESIVIDDALGIGKSATVDPDNFKITWEIEDWPFAAENHLQLQLKFTAESIGEVTLTSVEEVLPEGTFQKITCVTQKGDFNMLFLKEALTGAKDVVGTAGTVGVTMIDEIEDNGWVLVNIDLPQCADISNCKIAYDPSFNIDYTGAGLKAMFSVLVLLAILSLLL